MIESVEFHNFKALRDTTLPLGQFTLIVGPNGSGKTTAAQALQAARNPATLHRKKIATAGLKAQTEVRVVLHWASPHHPAVTKVCWCPNEVSMNCERPEGTKCDQELEASLRDRLARIRVYSLEARVLSQPVQLAPKVELEENGAHLAAVLDHLRDRDPERFEGLTQELERWVPEFDQILFDTPTRGHKSLALRIRGSHHPIPATELSQGTLLALAMLTIAYLPDPPPLVCFEEPDRGIHPRLLRDVKDALYRLSYPKDFGESRQPVQVIATTHSPYFLDLFKDHPEEIVIAHKEGQDARFERLSEQRNLDEILEDSHLGDAWYSGVLGGVPCQQ